MKPMALWLSAAILLALLGCNRPDAIPLARQAAIPQMMQLEGVRFTPPPQWTAEDSEGGVLLLSPEAEDNQQANIFLQVRDDWDFHPLEDALARYSAELAKTKQQYSEVERKTIQHPSGIPLGLIEYTSRSSGSDLTTWEILVEVAGGKQLFIMACSTTATWGKYKPVFEQFVDSLQIDPAVAQ